ncbi:plasmid replication protein RepC [Rhizobium calliandrae]|uniref:Plasmid replication protein RepC n=1 Tax=Rhizobium calliandrae TaxID=1312182 RepID=A0ABT7KB55_9HYPH|nr:plasmid replication protein RepC [Rhizobium calliandrae]MDL2405853.1 plasmid replication protein RepC [Rhizobium calliandrae]
MHKTNFVTTPFGRRSMTLAMLANQYEAKSIEPGKSIDKWKLFRALCEARIVYGISDRALAVLNALLSFYPENALSQENGLVIFPSNAQLSLRAHGIAPATLRRHLAALVGAGLLIRKDSPNGKRYARRDRKGEIDEAFGFSVAALIARADEIFAHATRIAADRDRLRITKERLSICRRDIAKLIDIALEEQAPGDWLMVQSTFRTITRTIPRTPHIGDLNAVLEELEMLRDEVLIRLERRLETQKQSAKESQTERHIQNTNLKNIFESEPDTGQNSVQVLMRDLADDERPPFEPLSNPHLRSRDASRSAQPEHGRLTASPAAPASRSAPLKSFPLGLVIQACPDVVSYGSGGKVENWRDLMTAAIVIRSMLAISPSVYQEACDVMGPQNAATVMACMLQRAEHIKSAGGYLRNLTRRAHRGEFAIGPMLMALARSRGLPERHAG